MEETTPSNQSTCPVCLRRLKRCRVGKPESCGHLFCFTCIFEWAKNVNTCPVDRIKFNTVHVFTHIGGKCIQKVDIPDSSLAEVNDDSNDMTYCEVCHEHTREDRLLLCDGCDKGYHLDCLRPPLSEVPDGDWYCSVCEPIIMAQYMATSSSEEEESDSCSALVVNCEYTSSYESFSDSGSSFEPTWGRNRRAGTQLQILDSSSSESEGVVLLAQQSKGKRAYRLMLSESSSSEDSDDESDDSLITQSIVSKRYRRNSILDLDEEESSQDSKSNLSQDPCSSSSDLLRDTRKVLPQTRSSRRNELVGCSSDYPSSDLCRDSDSFVARRRGVSSKKLICESDDESSSVVEEKRKWPGKVDAAKRSGVSADSYSAGKAAEIVTSAAQKHDQIPASSDVDDDVSIHSGYNSNCEGKSPGDVGSIELDLSSTTMSATVVESDIYSDYVPEEAVISQSAASVQDRRTQRGRSERNGGVVRAGVTSKEESLLNVKTLKVTGNGSKMSKPKTKLYTGRKRGRRGRGPKSIAQRGKRKRKRVRKRQRRRRKMRRTADSDDPGDRTYVPPLGFAPALRAAHRRFTRARTAATHSPHNNLIRAAVIAAHKHDNKEEGLHRAQAVMRQRRESLQNTPFRTSATAILSLTSNPSSLRNITTPTSGYSTPQHVGLPKRQEYNSPLSALSNGRTAPRCSSGLASSPHQSNTTGLPPAHIADGNQSQGRPKVNLMSDIFQNLDDLQNKNNFIRRDGTVVPVRRGSSNGEEQLPSDQPEVNCSYSEAESIVKKVLKPFYSHGDITSHEYGRILQRATKKVHQQFGPINLDRVNRLVVEYVQGYQESRRAAS